MTGVKGQTLQYMIMSPSKTSSTYVLGAVAMAYALVAAVAGADAPGDFASSPDSSHPQAVESKIAEYRKGVTLVRQVKLGCNK